MKKLLRPLAVAGALLLALAVPYRVFIGSFAGLFARLGGVDAVTSASVIIDKPSGSYIVLLNEDKHRKYGTADDWARFLNGESLVIMDDAQCQVIDQDAGGKQLAESYQSRLPENQMKLTEENGLMLLSKAERGGFDVIVLSREFADAYSANTVYDRENIRVLEIGGEGE